MLRCSFCIIPHVRPHLASRPRRTHRRRSPPAGRSTAIANSCLPAFTWATTESIGTAADPKASGLGSRIWLTRSGSNCRRLPHSAFEHRGHRSHARVDRRHGRPSRRRFARIYISRMQSGSDCVLRRMRRRWGSQRFIDRCRLVQERSISRRSRRTSSSAFPARPTPNLPSNVPTLAATSASRRSISSRLARGAARRRRRCAIGSRRRSSPTVRQNLHNWSANCEIVISPHCSAASCACWSNHRSLIGRAIWSERRVDMRP